MKPTFIIKNKTEWIRFQRIFIIFLILIKQEMWELSKPSPNSKQIMFLWLDNNQYKAMVKLMFFNKNKVKNVVIFQNLCVN